MVLDHLTNVSASGSGVFAHHSEHFWRDRRWGHVDGIRIDPGLACCRGFSSVPWPLQSVQRAEMWGVILALQTSCAVHLGVDNLGVVRHVGQLLDGYRGPKPFALVNDGDLLLLIDHMLQQRGLDTECISEVKGHADDGMVLHGQVRREDKMGNDAVDEAADFGRRRVCLAVIDARRNLSGVCGRWYLVVLDLHRFSLLFLVLWLIMMVLAVLLFTLLFGLLVLLVRGVVWFMRLVTVPFCLGSPRIWCSEWYQVPAAIISNEDVDLWPYTPGLFVKWVSFLKSLHWPIVIWTLVLGVFLMWSYL